MRNRFDLSALDWRLSGWTPHLWRLMQTMELGETPNAEVTGIPAKVPGSVQQALRDAGLLPDWNVGLNSRACEWVENRHWIYETTLPDEWFAAGKAFQLVCMGLDYQGTVYLNGRSLGDFCGTHVPHRFDLTPHLQPEKNSLRILFDLSPRWLGQFGYTSQVREWKARFNYTWDWIPRLVQIGIWEEIFIEATDGQRIEAFRCTTDADVESGTGILRVWGQAEAKEGANLRVTLQREGRVIRSEEIPVEQFNASGMLWRDLPVELWWTNLAGGQPLYQVHGTLLDAQGREIDRESRRVGFRNIVWRSCEGAPEGADPWLCVVNGKPIFLQGVNFVPLLPNFAEASPERYRTLLTLYRDLGVNTFRVNGVGYLEKEPFYDLCDEFGLLVWQDVPLSSSGVDNVPPDDENAICQVAAILHSFIPRRQHHPSLLLWSGGNELHERKEGYGAPCDTSHPLLKRLEEVVRAEDPGRRFLPTSATGPRFNADPKAFGKGLHWNVHGPWKPWDDLTGWEEYWREDDALFRAESGAPGACSADIIRQYAGDLDPMPVAADNPVWRRPLTWWIEAEQFEAEHGRPPQTLEEYVAWSQQRQARALSIAVGACKARFPRCGGVLLWCGHDCYPCPANTSLIDFHCQPKPAALALQKIWRGEPQP